MLFHRLCPLLSTVYHSLDSYQKDTLLLYNGQHEQYQAMSETY
jgi:hypothetical protein